MNEINVGVVGLGKMGALHYGSFASIPNVNVVCAAEANKQLCDYSKKMLDVPIYTNYKDLIKQNVDAVVICVPDQLHFEIGTYFTENGVNVFMEKPLADSVKNAEKMVRSSERNDVVTQVGYFNRFVSTFKKGKEIIDQGILGDIYHTRGFSYEGLVFERQKGWRFSKDADAGGSLLDIGSHLVDILMWYFGDIDALTGITTDAYSKTDFGSSIIKFKNGLNAVVDFSWSSYAHRQMHIEIHVEGSNGFMKVTNDYIKLFLKKGSKNFDEGWSTIYSVELYESTEFLLGVETAYYDEDNHFIECCKTNKRTDVDWKSGLKTQIILESILESNKKSKTVKI